MARQREPLPLPHGLTRFLPTNSGAKEKQVELAQIRDFCAQAGTFTGSHKEDIREYLHGVDKAARENGLSSFRTAKVLILQLLKGKAKAFTDAALTMPYRYPNANYYQEQLRVVGREHIRYQEAILVRIPSEDSTDGEVRTQSEDAVDSADSVDSVATVASIPRNDEAVPPIQHVPHIDRVHRIHRVHRRPAKHRRAEAVPPIHPRRRHISPRPEIPDLPKIDPEEPVQEDECLRHYLFEAFFKDEDPEIAHQAFLQTTIQDRSTSVRSWIWDMQAKQATWHKKLHGTQNFLQLARDNLAFQRQSESEIISAVKRNAVEEFKVYYQQMEASNPNCMRTIEQCHQIAFTFENNYEPGIKFTAKTKSETKRFAMEAQVYNYNDPFPAAAAAAPTQQLHNVPPAPPGLSQEQWQIALSAMSSNYNSQMQFQTDASSSGNFHDPDKHMENSSAAASSRGRGGANRGSPSTRGGRGGGGQGGANKSNSERQKPPPNPIHKNGKESWDPPQSLIATWTGTKPVTGKVICYYCALPAHTTSECGRRRKDLADNIDRPFHPDRGHLRGARFIHRVAQRMVKQGKAQNAADAMLQVEQTEQARLNQARAAARHSSSTAATSSAPAPPREGGTPYAQLQFPQFPTQHAQSYNQGSYNAHYSTAPANAATVAFPLRHPPLHATPGSAPAGPTAPMVPQPGANPILYLPPAPPVPDLRTTRPLNWAEDVNAEASAEEMRRANQVQNNLFS